MIKKIISLILSLLSIIGIYKFIDLNIINITLLFIISYLFIYYNAFKFKTKRNIIYCLIFSLIFAFFQVIGFNCYKYDFTYLNRINTYSEILSLIPIIYSVSSCIINLKFRPYKESNNKIIDILFNKKYSLLILMGLILLSWVTILYSFYPGNFSYDATTQINMVNYNLITKYHPVIHTLLLGKSILFGNMILDYNFGIFIYNVIQMLIMAFIFAYTIIFLHKNKLPNYLKIIFLLIYMFLPTHSMLSITTTKDVIFSGLFNLTIIKLIDLVKNTEGFFKYKLQVIFTILLIFLLLIFRNNTLYAFILFLPYTLYVLRKYFKKCIILFAIPLILYFTYNSILTNVLKIPNGPRVEAFSFVVQQLARTYNNENLNNIDRKNIEKLYNDNSLETYNSHISDYVKSHFNSEELFSNLSLYSKLYIKLGMKYPMTYIDSIFTNIYSFFYINDKLPDPYSKTYIEITCMGKNFERSDECKKNYEPIYDKYYSLLNDAQYQKIPILNIIMNIAFNIFIFILVCVTMLMKKKYKSFIPLLLLLCFLATNILAPVAILRYVYPIFTCMPLIIYLFYTKDLKEE